MVSSLFPSFVYITRVHVVFKAEDISLFSSLPNAPAIPQPPGPPPAHPLPSPLPLPLPHAPLSPFSRYSHFGQLIKNKQIAIIGDSLTSANFVPSLLCQINQLYWVSPKPELRTLDGGAWSKDSPEAVAYVYSIPQLNATIVMLWDDYLVRINQNAAMLAKVGGITDPKPADCLIDVATPNPQWARYLDEWDAVLLETTTHWRSLSKGPRMVYTNENWSKLSLDQYQAHRWVIAGDICLCLCLSTSTSASASASTSASASASASASGDMLSLSVSPHPSPHSPLSQSLTSIC
ncbi:unnamed protein product [Closterium sp. NIES-54]